MRRTDPGWSWNGPDIPKTKPPYTDLAIGLDGRIWVALIPESSQRVGSISGPASIGTGPPGRPPVRQAPVPEKDKQDQRPALYDVFEPTGFYVGQVEVPPRVSTVLRRGDYVWAVAFDDEDVARVKRYRIAWR